MVDSLDDPYTVYMDPEEYALYMERIGGSYSGVGMSVEMSDGMVTVVSTFKGSPAEVAGIDAGRHHHRGRRRVDGGSEP